MSAKSSARGSIARRPLGSGWFSRWVVPVLVLLGCLGVGWAFVAAAHSPFFPSPDLVIRQFLLPFTPGAIPDPNLFSITGDVIPSLTRMFFGFAASLVVGIVLGLIIGLSPLFEDYVDWILQFLRAVPPPIVFPVFLFVLGANDAMRIALICFGTLWPILLNTIEGVRGVEPLKFDTSEVFRISPSDRLFRIILPAAAPKILAGARTSLALALILMVVSEIKASTDGIGYKLLQANGAFAFADVWAAVVLLALLGIILNTIFTLIERRVLAWQRLAGRETS